MATREEILVGYQLINKVNTGNDCLDNSACFFRGLSPRTRDSLIVQEKEGGITRKPTLNELKHFTECDCAVVDEEVETRLQKFLLGFHDNQTIKRGLQYFRTQRWAVDGDKEEILTHTPRIRTVNALVSDFNGLKANGDLLSTYAGKVELFVDAKIHIPREQRKVTSYQDLLNAIAIELQGMCSYSGKIKYKTAKEVKEIVEGRLRVAEKVVRSCPDTQEVRSMSAVVRYIKRNLDVTVSLSDLSSLGEYVDSKVSQLPLVRRWWLYGNSG